MSQSFDNPKELRFVITLGAGSFGSSNANTITLQGYRAVVDIDKAGGMLMGTLRAQIYGVSQSDMNAVATYKYYKKGAAPNTVQVFAIDGSQETLVFSGNIVNAWGDYNAQPDVFLMIQSQAAYFAQINPVPPTSYPGAVDAVTALQQLAGNMDLTFENNGVSGIKLANQYLPNTTLEQAKTIAAAAGIWLYVDIGVLAIAPANNSRSGPVPIVSAETGLIAYPTFDGIGVNFKLLFNPAIRFGGSVQIQSSIPVATGTWIVVSISLRLESEKPDGAWFMTIRGTKGNLSIVQP
jgi:hypothetical protein